MGRNQKTIKSDGTTHSKRTDSEPVLSSASKQDAKENTTQIPPHSLSRTCNRKSQTPKLPAEVETYSDSVASSAVSFENGPGKANANVDAEFDVMKPHNRVDIVWRNVALFTYLHIAAAFGFFFFVTGQVLWQTFNWTFLLHLCGALGITAGAHRYWSHKSFKAKLPLKLILVFMQTVSFQNSIWEWSRDHRLHHKYSETNADPHDANRGFIFAHMGWLPCRKHPAVKAKGKQIDMSELEADPVIMFQHKHYKPLVLTCSFFMPTLLPWYFWGESFLVAWCFASQFRYAVNLHSTWLVNSAAHLWGDKPYDRNINPSENKFVTMFAFGEGWHNYHHVFPWDYKTAELGHYKYNFTTAFIDFFAWIGWAYDLKTVSDKMVRDRVRRTGDGSWKNERSSNATFTSTSAECLACRDVGMSHGGPWGWGDLDIPLADALVTQTLYSQASLHDE